MSFMYIMNSKGPNIDLDHHIVAAHVNNSRTGGGGGGKLSAPRKHT